MPKGNIPRCRPSDEIEPPAEGRNWIIIRKPKDFSPHCSESAYNGSNASDEAPTSNELPAVDLGNVLEEIGLLISSKKYTSAQIWVSNLMSQHPENELILRAQAELLYEQGGESRLISALVFIEKALEKDPTNTISKALKLEIIQKLEKIDPLYLTDGYARELTAGFRRSIFGARNKTK